MTYRLTRWWRGFKLRALRDFGKLIGRLTSLAFSLWALFMMLFLFLPSYRPLPTIQAWIEYQIGFNGPVWVGGLFFCGLFFLVSLLIDIGFALWHNLQIKNALFQVLNHQSYSDSLQPILDEVTHPEPPSQASSQYVGLRRWISDRITHDLAPGETVFAPDEVVIWRWIIKHIYRSSAFVGFFATAFYTLRGFAYGWNSRWPPDQPLTNAVLSALPHPILGLIFCGLFLLIYTLITLGDHIREESREWVSLLYELTGSTANTSIQDTPQYEDTLGLHSLEETQFQVTQSSNRK